MSLKSKAKEFPSQVENRKQWILDTVRANQVEVGEILSMIWHGEYADTACRLQTMNTMDRDALLQPGGILTDEQIRLLSSDPS